MSNISILVDDDLQETKGGTLGPKRGGSKPKVKEIATEKLQASIAALQNEMGEILQDAKQVGGFKLKEVQLQVEVSAEGSIVLIGKAGVSGAITLTFAPE